MCVCVGRGGSVMHPHTRQGHGSHLQFCDVGGEKVNGGLGSGRPLHHGAQLLGQPLALGDERAREVVLLDRHCFELRGEWLGDR